MKCRQTKNSCLTHTGLGLAYNVTTQNGLGDRLVLDFTGVLETGVYDGTEQFWLQKEIFKTRRVNSDVVTSAKGKKILAGAFDFVHRCIRARKDGHGKNR